MTGAVHASEPIWAGGKPVRPTDLRPGDEVDSVDAGRHRRARVEKTRAGRGQGTIWLHTASGACIRCLLDERVAVYTGRRVYRTAQKVGIGDFLLRVVGGRETVDPVVATRSLSESVPVVYLTIPAVSLVSEEGILCRPAS